MGSDSAVCTSFSVPIMHDEMENKEKLNPVILVFINLAVQLRQCNIKTENRTF